MRIAHLDSCINRSFNMDIIYVGISLGLIVLSLGFITLCERL